MSCTFWIRRRKVKKAESKAETVVKSENTVRKSKASKAGVKNDDDGKS